MDSVSQVLIDLPTTTDDPPTVRMLAAGQWKELFSPPRLAVEALFDRLVTLLGPNEAVLLAVDGDPSWSIRRSAQSQIVLSRTEV